MHVLEDTQTTWKTIKHGMGIDQSTPSKQFKRWMAAEIVRPNQIQKCCGTYLINADHVHCLRSAQQSYCRSVSEGMHASDDHLQ